MAVSAGSTMTKKIPVATVGCCGVAVGEPLDVEVAAQLARGFAALGDPVRLRVLNLIAGSGEMCSCDLVEPIGKSQPTISHHTKVLAEAGLIAGEKRGKWTWWRVVPEQLSVLRAAVDTGS